MDKFIGQFAFKCVFTYLGFERAFALLGFDFSLCLYLALSGPWLIWDLI